MSSSVIVVYAEPLVIYLSKEDAFINRDVFYDCIPIHGNTVFTSFSISPDLPQDLSIDRERSCIGGTYTGSYYGSQEYHLNGKNYLGEASTWITLYFSRNRLDDV